MVGYGGSCPVALTCANVAASPCFWYAPRAALSPSPYTSDVSVRIWFATYPAIAARFASSHPEGEGEGAAIDALFSPKE